MNAKALCLDIIKMLPFLKTSSKMEQLEATSSKSRLAEGNIYSISPVFSLVSLRPSWLTLGQTFSFTSSIASCKIHKRNRFIDCPWQEGFSAKQSTTPFGLIRK